MMPTRELYVQGTQEPQPLAIEPPHWRTGGLKTTALAIGPSMSLTSFTSLPFDGGCSQGGGSYSRPWYFSRGCVCVCLCKNRGDILIIQGIPEGGGGGCTSKLQLCMHNTGSVNHVEP